MKDTRLQLIAFGLGLGIYSFVDLVVWEYYEREIKRDIPAITYNILNLAFLIVVVLASVRFYKFIKSNDYKSKPKAKFVSLVWPESFHVLVSIHNQQKTGKKRQIK